MAMMMLQDGEKDDEAKAVFVVSVAL